VASLQRGAPGAPPPMQHQVPIDVPKRFVQQQVVMLSYRRSVRGQSPQTSGESSSTPNAECNATRYCSFACSTRPRLSVHPPSRFLSRAMVEREDLGYLVLRAGSSFQSRVLKKHSRQMRETRPGQRGQCCKIIEVAIFAVFDWVHRVEDSRRLAC